MSQAEMPFFDSPNEATKFAIQSSGKTYKQVGAALWPQKTPEQASTLLANALNDNRKEELDSSEHIFIGKYCQRFYWLYHACIESDHTIPTPITPEDRKADLQRQYIEAAKAVERIGQAILSQQQPVRASRAA